MTTEIIKLPRLLTNQLLHAAQIAGEQEICGLVGARESQPTTCYPIENIAEQPERHFQLNPQQQIEAMRQMRQRNESLFAIYHSHPNTPAEPSATDIELASYPDALYLIISLNTKGVLEMRGFRLNQQHTEEVNLELQ